MVLDTRHLRYEVPSNPGLPTVSEPDDAQPPPANAQPPPALPDPESVGQGIEELLDKATSADLAIRANAAERLRQIVPSESGMERLWCIADDPDEPRRLIALQVLGFHRSWIGSRTRLRRAIEMLKAERDPDLSSVLAWCLRNRSELGEFLRHAQPGAAMEAAIGLPLNANTLPAAVEVVLGSTASADVSRVLLEKCRQLHPSLVQAVVELLVAQQTPADSEIELLSQLPQVALFEALFHKCELGQWEPIQGFKSADTARRLSQISQKALDILRREPEVDLVRFVLAHSGEDEDFARRHAAFLREIIKRVDGRDGGALVKHFERLTSGASEDKVARLAQLLVELSARLEGGAEHQAAQLLEEWKDRSAALRLKIYHLQQGLG